MTNAGPLTTTFTAPSSCATATGLYQIWGDDGFDTYHYEQGPLASKTDCFPSGYDASPSQYYSPGVCPQGYTAACSSTDVVSGTATETAYTCCPTAADYTCAGGNAVKRTLGSGDQQYLGCTTTFGHAVAVAGATAISGGSTYSASAVTEAAGQGVGANSIAVRFKSGDFAAATTTTTGGQAGTTTATAVLSLATAPSPQPSQNSHGVSSSNTGLSTAGIAGIGAGSAAGVLMLVSIFGLFWLRRRRTRKQQQQSSKALLRRPPPRGHPPPPSFSSSLSTPRGPPPPRPPRPYPGPPLSSPSSSSSSRDRNRNKVYDYQNWPYSPSLAPSDEDTYIDDDIVDIVDEAKSKQLCATTTTIRNVKNMALVNGPFELDSYSIDENYTKSESNNKNYHHNHGEGSLHELYGSNHHHPLRSSPSYATTSSPSQAPAAAATLGGAGDPHSEGTISLLSSGQRQPRSPPPAYGYGGGGGGGGGDVGDGGYYHQSQVPRGQHGQKGSIYELETPQRVLRSPTQRHRRMPSERLGTSWAPAELASHAASGFL